MRTCAKFGHVLYLGVCTSLDYIIHDNIVYVVNNECSHIYVTPTNYGKVKIMSKMAGIECEFVEKPPKAVQSECPICVLVLREPYQATCCGKSFCKECIERVKANNKDCPTCNDKNFNLFHNKGLQQSLNDFEVYCSHKSKGCEWRGELRELDKHLNSDPPADKFLEGCPFTVIKCPLGCASCEKGVYRKDVKSHVNDKLLNHVVTQTAELKSLKQQVQAALGANAQLSTQVQEMTLINTQLQGDKRRLELRVTQLEAEPYLRRPSTYLTGTVKPTGAEFTMTGFEEYKREDDEWYSPHFYTHRGGYKMCLSVDANGNGSGKSTHLSVKINLMKGEYDDLLKWPFRGSITVLLLSQENEDHFVKHIPFKNAAASSCNRVVLQERAVQGKGLSKFLPHTELNPNYLKNDCIKLRIRKIDLA